MWEEGRKMEDPEVIVQALNEAGLDGQTPATPARRTRR